MSLGFAYSDVIFAVKEPEIPHSRWVTTDDTTTPKVKLACRHSNRSQADMYSILNLKYFSMLSVFSLVLIPLENILSPLREDKANTLQTGICKHWSFQISLAANRNYRNVQSRSVSQFETHTN